MTNTFAAPAATRLAAATPAGRDRYADLLRLYSIAMVALGHWVVALLTVGGTGTASSSMPIMLSTWVWQVMALFFFVGGFAHAHALRRRPTLAGFVRARMARLLPPAVALLTVWTGLAALLGTAGLVTGELATGLHMITVPLWFLGVYLLIVLAAPTMMRLHTRFGLCPVLGALTLAASAVDLVSLGAGVHLVGYANLLFVWLAVHQLGFGYADGTLLRGGRRLAGAMAAGGLAGTILLVFGTRWYPVLMVGLPGNQHANSTPPTLALLTQGFFLVGVALLLHPIGTRLARRRTAWLVIAVGNSVIMTVFCWHLSACYLVRGVLLVLGTRLPEPSTPAWWAVLAGWLVGGMRGLGAAATSVRTLLGSGADRYPSRGVRGARLDDRAVRGVRDRPGHVVRAPPRRVPAGGGLGAAGRSRRATAALLGQAHIATRAPVRLPTGTGRLPARQDWRCRQPRRPPRPGVPTLR
jgi:acyltransferase-like protein